MGVHLCAFVLLCNNNTIAGFTDFLSYFLLYRYINVFDRGSKAMMVFCWGWAGRPECSAVMCSQSESRLCSLGTVA